MAAPFVIWEFTAFTSDLKKAVTELAEDARGEIRQDCAKIVDRSKSLIHSVPLPDEGLELKNSMGWRQTKPNEFEVGSFDNDHNIYVEFGTHTMDARPYLRPPLLEYEQGKL